jgi:hypothetical protein
MLLRPKIFLLSKCVYHILCTLPNLLVATTATHAQHAPINKHTAIPFGPSVPWCSSAGASLSSGLFPGSRIENTAHDIPVPTNCGKVVYRFMMPRYLPELAPPDELADSSGLWRGMGEARERGMEGRRVWWVDCERRFISTPRKAKGAQQATDQELLRISTRKSRRTRHYLHATHGYDERHSS